MRISGILLGTAILGFCFASQAQAQSQVYRSTDAEGNVTFSDQPTPESETVDVAPTNVGDSIEVPPPTPVTEPKVVVEKPPAAPEGTMVGVEEDSDDGGNWRRRPRVIHHRGDHRR
jgi:Domain of unknown function (DUF4124)